MRPRLVRQYFFQSFVSIHASVKDATRLPAPIEPKRPVSIHASVKDATPVSRQTGKPMGFNPRICKRCDDGTTRSYNQQYVSIHASVKDATGAAAGAFGVINVSIHASVKDATQVRRSAYFAISFNPRICKRCDTNCPPTSSPFRFQSTHL